jgi:hypothetical protein
MGARFLGRAAALTSAFALAVAWPRSAAAECKELGGIGAALGLGIASGTSLVTGFVVPGIAKAANPGLPYWAGFGWAYGMAMAGTATGYSA